MAYIYTPHHQCRRATFAYYIFQHVTCCCQPELIKTQFLLFYYIFMKSCLNNACHLMHDNLINIIIYTVKLGYNDLGYYENSALSNVFRIFGWFTYKPCIKQLWYSELCYNENSVISNEKLTGIWSDSMYKSSGITNFFFQTHMWNLNVI